MDEPKYVYSRRTKGEKVMRGVLTGSERHCQLEGCLGRRLGVRWPGGRMTWPCTKGMKIVQRGKAWQIL